MVLTQVVAGVGLVGGVVGFVIMLGVIVVEARRRPPAPPSRLS